jgi:predicted nucleotidyltransferase
MLHNDTVETPDVIRKFMRSTVLYVFHLTGSRFFGTATEDSDWDFFIEDPARRHVNIEYNIEPRTKLTDKLTEFGFSTLSFTSYTDQHVIEVWRHKESKIDIQIVKDAFRKTQAQNYIRMHPGLYRLYKTLNKCQHNDLWDLVYACNYGMLPERSQFDVDGLENLAIPLNKILREQYGKF